MPYPHRSGIAECDESSLLIIHHKISSEILCPKLCVIVLPVWWLLVQWEVKIAIITPVTKDF